MRPRTWPGYCDGVLVRSQVCLMEKPQLSDFGLTESVVEQVKEEQSEWERSLLVKVIFILIAISVTAGVVSGDSAWEKLKLAVFFMPSSFFLLPSSLVGWFVRLFRRFG